MIMLTDSYLKSQTESCQETLEFMTAVAASTFLKMTHPVVFNHFSFPWIIDSSLLFSFDNLSTWSLKDLSRDCSNGTSV
jgi:hypothetical protein